MLRRLNLPAILELTTPDGKKHQVVLTAPRRRAGHARDRRSPCHDADRGDRALLGRRARHGLEIARRPDRCRSSPACAGGTSRGSAGELGALDGRAPSAGASQVYDEELKRRVAAFQQVESLAPDGIAGEETLVRLAAAAPGASGPSLTSVQKLAMSYIPRRTHQGGSAAGAPGPGRAAAALRLAGAARVLGSGALPPPAGGARPERRPSGGGAGVVAQVHAQPGAPGADLRALGVRPEVTERGARPAPSSSSGFQSPRFRTRSRRPWSARRAPARRRSPRSPGHRRRRRQSGHLWRWFNRRRRRRAPRSRRRHRRCRRRPSAPSLKLEALIYSDVPAQRAWSSSTGAAMPRGTWSTAGSASRRSRKTAWP